MRDRSTSDPDGGPGAPEDDPSARVLRQAIEHVDQLLERLDREPRTPAVPADGVDEAPAVQLASAVAELSGPAGTRAQAVTQAARLILLARDAAERMRSQAQRASTDAAATGRRLVSDAVRAAAALQADAERNWAECEAFAHEQSRAADEAIRILLAGPFVETDVTDVEAVGVDYDAEPNANETEVEQAVEAAVRDMETLRTERRRHVVNRR